MVPVKIAPNSWLISRELTVDAVAANNSTSLLTERFWHDSIIPPAWFFQSNFLCNTVSQSGVISGGMEGTSGALLNSVNSQVGEQFYLYVCGKVGGWPYQSS